MARTPPDKFALLRRFEQLHMLTTEPAKMGEDLLTFGPHEGATFEQGYENQMWLHNLLGRTAPTTPDIDRFLSYVEWRIAQAEMNANIPKDADNEHCETGSAASNPTKEKVRTGKTVLTKPPTCSSSIPKDPTVQTVLKTEEEDDSDWAEMEATEIQALLEDRIQNIDKIHRRWFKTTNSRISDVEKRLLNIEMLLAEIIHKLSTFHNIETN
jgi:hypothetical protein